VDFLVLGIGIAFFLLTVALVRLCDNLMKEGQ